MWLLICLLAVLVPLSFCPSFCLSVHLYFCLSVSLSVCESVCLFACEFIFLFVFLYCIIFIVLYCIIPVMMYGPKCWCLRKEDERRILVAEMSWLRRILGKFRRDRLRNEVTRKELGQQVTLVEISE